MTAATEATLLTREFEGSTVPTPATFGIDVVHSEVGFLVKHMMVSKTRGRFGKYEGQIVVAENILDSSVEIDVDVTSIDTRDEKRDAHLRSPDFFETDTHPKLQFRSTSFAHKGGDSYAVTGDLTIKGVTKPITLDVTYEGVVVDPYGGQRIGFTAKGEIDRYDYDLTWGSAMEAGGLVVGKKINLEFEIEAVRAA